MRLVQVRLRAALAATAEPAGAILPAFMGGS